MPQNSQQTVITALILMTFMVVVALLFRPQGAIRFGVGGSGPQVTIDDPAPKSK